MEMIDNKIPENMPEDLTPEQQDEWMRKQCPMCGEEIIEEAAGECRRNNKIITFLTAEEAQPLVHGSIESIPCPKHPTKVIDFFCKTCS